MQVKIKKSIIEIPVGMIKTGDLFKDNGKYYIATDNYKEDKEGMFNVKDRRICLEVTSGILVSFNSGTRVTKINHAKIKIKE